MQLERLNAPGAASLFAHVRLTPQALAASTSFAVTQKNRNTARVALLAFGRDLDLARVAADLITPRSSR